MAKHKFYQIRWWYSDDSITGLWAQKTFVPCLKILCEGSLIWLWFIVVNDHVSLFTSTVRHVSHLKRDEWIHQQGNYLYPVIWVIFSDLGICVPSVILVPAGMSGHWTDWPPACWGWRAEIQVKWAEGVFSLRLEGSPEKA